MKIRLSESDVRLAREEYFGYCLSCGAERDCTEPDACNYPCEDCGEDSVFGIEELMMMGEIIIDERM